MSTLALCPSRGRPAQAGELLASFEATRRDPGSRLVFVLDRDDPTLGDYPGGMVHVVEPGGCMGAALAKAGRDRGLLADATSVGMVGDDNRFRTPGWDVVLDGFLSSTPAIAYGDDGFQHERLPTSWWVSRPIVDVFGMVDPRFRHYYMDNYWQALGQGAGILRYFPDVVIEHLHPLAGKAEDDATYQRGLRAGRGDKMAYRMWDRTIKHRDIARLRAIVGRDQPRRVLADWHHPALWESLAILFEDRFGWELYSPIGADWTRHGWSFEGGTPGWTADDYLTFPDAVAVDGHWERTELEYPDRPRKMMTWAQASGTQWDFVLASVPAHQRPFSRLARMWGARLIHQVGNARHSIDRSIQQVTLASVRTREQRNLIPYHQEFSRDLFAYREPTEPARVTSLMLRLEATSCPFDWFAGDPAVVWQDAGGSDPRDGRYLAPMSRVAETIAASGWIWHDKRIGDGYGHVLHNAAAMGRPLIGHASHYRGLLGEPLWRDLETCIDLDRYTERNALRIWNAIVRDPDWYREMTEQTAATFDRLVDFDAEADRIREALS